MKTAELLETLAPKALLDGEVEDNVPWPDPHPESDTTWLQAQLAVGRLLVDQDDFLAVEQRKALPVLLYAAAAMDESLSRVSHWLQRLTGPDDLAVREEIDAILEWRKQMVPLEAWRSFTANDPKLRQDTAVGMLKTLEEAQALLKQLEQDTEISVDEKLTINGQLALQQHDRDSSWSWVEAFSAVLLLAFILSAAGTLTYSAITVPASKIMMVTAVIGVFVGLYQVIKAVRTGQNLKQAQLDAWRQLANDSIAPLEPASEFSLLVAEKRVSGEHLIFACALYSWNDHDGWSRQQTVRPPALNGKIPDVWSVDTPIEQLSSAWADYREAVNTINERNYQQLLADQSRQARAQLEQRDLSLRQKQQLASSAQIADLLPGPTVIPKKTS